MTPSQFLELEMVCDRFEEQLRNGSPVNIAECLEKADPDLRRPLQRELLAIQGEFESKPDFETTGGKSQTLPLLDNPMTLANGQSAPLSPRFAEHLHGKLQRFGRFKLHSVLGRGGSGVVWRALDTELERWVALKLPHPDSVVDPSRFIREARAAANLTHPNIVSVFEAGEWNGQCYMVSELIEGQSLADNIREQEQEIRRAVEVVLMIARAVAHSHAAGIIHRDIKPQNILMDKFGNPMIADFGLAKNLGFDQSLTRNGDLIGTPAYMAPEQAMGDAWNCDERADIYGVGVVFFQLLTGEVPFKGSFERIIFQVIHATPPKINDFNKAVHDDLSVICLKCLEKSPDQRFTTANELANELQRFLDGKPIFTRPVSTIGRYLRWLKREPRVAWLTTLCAMLLSVTAIGSTVAALMLRSSWQQEHESVIESRQSEQIANQNAKLARQQSNVNRQTAEVLASMFEPADLMGVNRTFSGSGFSRGSISSADLEKTVHQVDQLLAKQPIARARVNGILGNYYRSTGQYEKSETMLDEAARILDENSAAGDPNLETDRATNLLYRAYLNYCKGEASRSEELFCQSIERFQIARQHREYDVIVELQLAQANFGFACLLLGQKRNQEAIPYLQQALMTRRTHLQSDDSLLIATELVWIQCQSPEGVEPGEWPLVLQRLNKSVVNNAMFLYWGILHDRKQKAYADATQKYEKLLSLIPDFMGRKTNLHILAIGDLASLYWDSGDYTRALPLIVNAIEEGKAISPEHPKLISAIMKLAYELKLAHRFEEAKSLYLETQQLSIAAKYQVEIDSGLVDCYLGENDPAAALVHSSRLLDQIGKCMAQQTAWYCYCHARVLTRLGNTEEAARYNEQALETVRRMSLPGMSLPDDTTWLSRMGIILDQENHQLAESIFRKELENAKVRFVAGHPRIAGAQFRLGENLIRQQRTDEARPLLERVLELQIAKLPADDQRIAFTRDLLQSTKDQ